MKILIPIIILLFIIFIFLTINEPFDNIGYVNCISQNVNSNNLSGQSPPTTIQTDLVNLSVFIDNILTMINTQDYKPNKLDILNIKDLAKKTMEDVNKGYKDKNFNL
jgi:hypothetical protein